MSIFKSVKKTLVGIVLAGTLTGCGCEHDNDEPVNHAPNFTSAPVTAAVENSPYNYDANADDPDTGDTLTYSLTQAPTGMAINSSTGLIQWIPTDAQSGMSHNISIKVEDGQGGSDIQDYTITNVTNVETISGYVFDAMDDVPLEDIDVTIGPFTDTTDSAGHWEIQDVPDGDYPAQIKDSTDTYETFKPGFFRVGKLEKLTQDAIIYKQADRDFINNTIRSHGLIEIAKWITKPKFRIYTKELISSGDVAPATIAQIKNIIQSEYTQFANDSYDFTLADIEEVNTIPVAGEIPGYIKIYWDDSFGSGANFSWFNANEITGSYARFNTAAGESTQIQELIECLIGGGETTNINYNDSVLYDPSSAIVLSAEDQMLSELIYSQLQRPRGNRDYTTADNHDRNPDTNQWNLSFTGAKSAMSYQATSDSKSYDIDYSDCLEEEDNNFKDSQGDYKLQEESYKVF